jgi:hypothetical protein
MISSLDLTSTAYQTILHATHAQTSLSGYVFVLFITGKISCFLLLECTIYGAQRTCPWSINFGQPMHNNMNTQINSNQSSEFIVNLYYTFIDLNLCLLNKYIQIDFPIQIKTNMTSATNSLLVDDDNYVRFNLIDCQYLFRWII